MKASKPETDCISAAGADVGAAPGYDKFHNCLWDRGSCEMEQGPEQEIQNHRSVSGTDTDIDACELAVDTEGEEGM